MRAKAEIKKWETKVSELEQQMAAQPTPKNAEMLSDARNYLRNVKTRFENMSKRNR